MSDICACIHCNIENDTDDMFETHNGDYCCNNCSWEHCSRCFDGPCEVETPDGEVICVDCFSSAIDDAYDRIKDMEYSD